MTTHEPTVDPDLVRATPRLPGPTRRFAGLLALCCAPVYALAVFSGSAGRVIPDTPYDYLVRPLDALARTVGVWDATIGTGRTYPRYYPVSYLPFAFFRLLGAEPWVAQRLFHVLLLVVATVGAAVLGRRLGLGTIAAVVAGLVYGVGPAAIAGITPSLLFLHYAIAPLLVIPVVDAIDGRPVRRCAAAIALAAFVGGGLNLPALVYAALPAGVMMLWAIGTGALPVRRAARLVGFAGLAWVAMMLPYILQLRSGADFLQVNLDTTETLEAVASNSSLSESWRQLGYWLAYFDLSGQPALGRTTPYFEVRLVALATYALTIAALVGLARRPVLARGPWPAMAAVGVVALSGAFRTPDGTLFASLFTWFIEDVPGALGMRNYYKAAPALGLAVALGCGSLAGAFGRSPRRLSRAAFSCAFVVTLVAVASPLRGSLLYDIPGSADDGVPDYVDEAAHWLDARADDGRVLVAPMAATLAHRWGEVGPEVWLALVDRPVIAQPFLPAGTPDAANALATLHDLTSDPRYTPGTLGTIARRYGVEYVLIENDLVWQGGRVPRPVQMQALRDDPDLELVATFGRRGENTTDPFDESTAAEAERRLPPVEIYRVIRHVAPVHARVATPPVLVSGDAAAIVALERQGVIAPGAPTRYTARSSPTELAASLDGGSALVITDTNRRRSRPVESVPSATLAADDDRRAVADLFAVAGSQSVVVHPDAVSIREIAPPTLFEVGPESRPAAAFDRDASTAWLTGVLSDRVGQRLRVDLGSTRRVDRIEVQRPPVSEGSRRVTSIRVHTSTGETRQAAIDDDGRAVVTLAEARVSWVEIEIAAVTGEGTGPFGLGEIVIGDLDLREFIRVPDDVARAADADPDLADRLAAAPLAYSFALGGPGIVETGLRREFETPAARTYDLTGAMLVSPADIARRAIASSGITVVADASLDGTDPSAVLDVDPSTRWFAPGPEGELTMTVGREIDGPMTIVAEGGSAYGRIYEIVVRGWTARPRRLSVADARPCTPVDGTDSCPLRFEVPAPDRARRVDEVSIVVRSFGLGGTPAPVGLIEVEIPGVTAHDASSLSCADDVVRIDGDAIAVRLAGTVEELRRSGVALFSSCEPVALGRRSHRLEQDAGALLSHVVLSSGDPVAAAGDLVAVATDDQGAVDVDLVVPATPDALILSSGQSYSPALRLELDGGGSIDPISIDGLAAFAVEPSNVPRTGRVRHVGTSSNQWSIALSVAVALACLVALVRAPRVRADPTAATVATPRVVTRWGARMTAAARVVARPGGRMITAARVGAPALVGLLVGGTVGAAVGVVVGAAMVRWSGPALASRLLVSAALAIALVAAISVFGAPADAGLLYTSERRAAEPFAAAAVVLVVGAALAPGGDRSGAVSRAQASEDSSSV